MGSILHFLGFSCPKLFLVLLSFFFFRNLFHIFSHVLGLSLGLFDFIFLYLILG